MQTRIDQLCEMVAKKENLSEGIEKFLSQGESIDINTARHSIYKTKPLAFAAQSGSYDTFRYFIETQQANLDASEETGNILDWSLDNTADIRTYIGHSEKKLWLQFKDGTTELHVAAACGQLETVKKILDENPTRLFEMNNHGMCPLDFAVAIKHKDILNLLINRSFAYIETQLIAENDKDVAIAYLHLASYHKLFTDCNQAIAAAENGVEYCQSALRGMEDDSQEYLVMQRKLAECHHLLGLLYLQIGREYQNEKNRQASLLSLDRARLECLTALNDYEKIPEVSRSKKDISQVNELRIQIGSIFNERGRVNDLYGDLYNEKQEREAALMAYEYAISDFDQADAFLSYTPSQEIKEFFTANLVKLTFTYFKAASLYHQQGSQFFDEKKAQASIHQYENSIDYSKKAIEFLKSLPEEEQKKFHVNYYQSLANTYYSLSVAYDLLCDACEENENWLEAITFKLKSISPFTAAIDCYEKFIQQNQNENAADDIIIWEHDLAMDYNELGNCYFSYAEKMNEIHEEKSALIAYQKSIKHHEIAVKKANNVFDFVVDEKEKEYAEDANLCRRDLTECENRLKKIMEKSHTTNSHPQNSFFNRASLNQINPVDEKKSESENSEVSVTLDI